MTTPGEADPKALEKRLTAIAQRFEAHVATLNEQLPEDEKQILNAYLQTLHRIQMVTFLFFEGLSSVESGAPMRASPEAEVSMRNWILSEPPWCVRWTLAGNMAASSCAALEELLYGCAIRWTNAGTITRLQRLGERWQRKEAAEIQTIAQRVRPSGKNGGKPWMRRVEDVFECEVDSAVQDGVCDMIAFRNRFLHGETLPGDAAASLLPNGSVFIAWHKATRHLGRTVFLGRIGIRKI